MVDYLSNGMKKISPLFLANRLKKQLKQPKNGHF